ncbi:uncharacterized protein LOC114944339 [Nylanderia fulva]|uniref:uncharacterized protein LOC114944339 n=1 Tax=Nylanderia fulva TaxID=613905 RepID=UPI0010FB4B23|nr:uncharacterized protein LOC114944339 [Nylanderia fulva]
MLEEIINGIQKFILDYQTASMTSDAARPIVAQLEERKNKLNEYWSDHNDVQMQFESLDKNEASNCDNFEEAFFSLSGRIRELIKPALPNLTEGSRSSSRASGMVNTHFNVRLPKLNLPTFSGKYDEWFLFHDSFNSIIHSNRTLNNIQKLQYLKSALTGDASSVVDSLEINDLNYDITWNLLKKRYNNKRVVVQTHVKTIMDLPSMPKENLVDLRHIADGATKHIKALEALGRPTSHWDDLIVHVLSFKLDTLTM